MVACGDGSQGEPVRKGLDPANFATATPTPAVSVPQPNLEPVTEAFRLIVPAPAPAAIVPGVAAAAAGAVTPLGFSWDNDPACLAREDRYDWRRYALQVGFPAEVVAGAEMGQLITAESGGDLCAVNDFSGATCWIQQYRGGPQFLDPVTCMSIGYAKWLDGGGSFQRHWYAHWQ